MLDPAGNVTTWSRGAEHLKGYRAEEIIGQHFSVFYPPERIAVGYPEWELAHTAEVGSHIDEGWRLRKDGTRFWAHVVLSALRSADGSLRGFAKLTRDDTNFYMRLQRSSRRFADLFTLGPVGMGRFDESAHLVDANEALADLLGYPPHLLHGMSDTALLHPHDPTGAFIPGTGAESPTGRRRLSNRVLARSDGEPVYCDLHLASSIDNEGSLFWLVAFQDVTERHRHAEMLRYQATHDELTGLANRKAVNDLLADLLSGPDPAPVAVLFCDIDNFKRINDSLGHEVGDNLLITLARRLEDGLPPGCVPARPGGDEFVIVCPDVDAVGGDEALATRVSDLLRMTVPVEGELVQLSTSVGLAGPGTATGGKDLLRLADAAMFEAKHRGPGHVSLATHALLAASDRQLPLEGQLRDALQNDGLSLHYQPIVTADGVVIMAEALLRWLHPARGLLDPDDFLPLAKQGSLSRDLDRWVLHNALREAATWPKVHDRPVSIAVNLADLIPADPHFLDEVSEIIAESGIGWRRVVLELVETSLIELSSRPRMAMRELSGRGVRFAVDDFGAGYSSLSRLKDLPVQIIKTDRRFISGLGADPGDLAVATAVADIARAMGRDSIAEGVETATQFRLLSRIGMTAYQGWLFSPAVPPQELRTILDRGVLPTPNDILRDCPDVCG